MWHYLFKISLTVGIVVAATEIAKRSSFWAALLTALPVTVLVIFAWLYVETGSTERVAALAHSLFWMFLPSLTLFLVLPALLRAGVAFWPSLAAASAGVLMLAARIVIHGVQQMLSFFGAA